MKNCSFVMWLHRSGTKNCCFEPKGCFSGSSCLKCLQRSFRFFRVAAISRAAKKKWTVGNFCHSKRISATVRGCLLHGRLRILKRVGSRGGFTRGKTQQCAKHSRQWQQTVEAEFSAPWAMCKHFLSHEILHYVFFAVFWKVAWRLCARRVSS